jgi:hypothetical protein
MRTILLLLSALLATRLAGQANTVAAGIEAVVAAGSMSVSIGQVAPLYMAASGASVNQGVQQPYPQSISTGTMAHEDGGVHVYPNPAHDHVRVAGLDHRPMTYRLLATDGRLLRSGMLPLEGTIALSPATDPR